MSDLHEKQLPEMQVKTRSINVKYLLSEYGIVLAFLILVLALSFASPYFLRMKNIMNVLRQTSINALLSLGMTFVILTGGIDLSVGSILAFGGIVAASLASDAMGGTIYPPLVAAGAGLIGGLGLGAVNGILVARLAYAGFCCNPWNAQYGQRVYLYLYGWNACAQNRREFSLLGTGSNLRNSFSSNYSRGRFCPCMDCSL